MNDCICNEILNLNSNSTLKDARRNYLRLCLKFHPDKNSGNSEKFVQINNAYEYFKKNNKTYVIEECNSNFQWYLIFLGCFIKTADIILSLKIDLEDIYNLKTKKLVYSRLKSDFQFVKEVLYLELSSFQYNYVIDDYGDFNMSTGHYNNLNIKVDVIYPKHMDIHINDTISMCDLYYNRNISIYEYYYGLNDDLPYLNDESINTKGYVPNMDGDILVVDNKGLMNDDNEQRDKLYVFFKVDMKIHNLRAKNKDTVKELFNS
jgi:DnaJ-class molecular chaperone